ncbi:hypothetical protein [uncultured Tateyamaria sp.]|uniref:hypothetical protein n=1 Tax=uncultured Tateyamaria sp. TaxID=455651 RepID=UPI00260FD524|nr:hypothetical protein [uncultured Tateyamaria sp.]
MSFLPILGGGGVSQPPQSPQSPIETARTDQSKETPPPEGTAEPSETSPPTAASETGNGSAVATPTATDQRDQSAKVDLTADPQPSTAQSVVEAKLADDPAKAEADARRFAEASLQQRRLEQLIEAVGTPVQTRELTPAGTENTGQIDTPSEGVPV